MDDASIFFLASLPKESYVLLELIFALFSTGDMKGQKCPRGSLGKKLDLKGFTFKPMRGLDTDTITNLLHQLAAKEMTLSDMATECKKVKLLREVQKAFLAETGVKSWEEACEKFPLYANAEALDQFILGKGKHTASNRYVFQTILGCVRMQLID